MRRRRRRRNSGDGCASRSDWSDDAFCRQAHDAILAAGMVRTTMFLGIAFTEALALIGFVVFILIGL